MEGWESRLNLIIESARHEPYAIGEHDCFRLACRVIEALTGVDRWPEFQGYRTKREALAKLARYGGSFEAAGDWFFGVRRQGVALAQRGDVLALRTADGQKHLGISLGHRVAFLSENGLIFLSPEQCLCAWSVGHA